MARETFDSLILANVEADRVTFDDLSIVDRYELVARYFQENPEWGDALYEDADLLVALRSADYANLGRLVLRKAVGYVLPYIEKQLRYAAMCKREQQEMQREHATN